MPVKFGQLVLKLRSPKVLAATTGTIAVALITPSAWAWGSSAPYRTDVEDAQPRDVALVLGAGIYEDGQPTPFLRRRLELAVELYRRDKVKAILVSGDNGRTTYDEPTSMRDWLLGQGIPQDKIVLDHAGFDTWDSCVRARKVFGVTSATVVSQSFHLGRAVALCRRAGIDALGVGDDSAKHDRRLTWYLYAREVPAMLKAMDDVVFTRDPKFLGPQEPGVQKALGRAE